MKHPIHQMIKEDEQRFKQDADYWSAQKEKARQFIDETNHPADKASAKLYMHLCDANIQSAGRALAAICTFEVDIELELKRNADK